MSFSLAFQAATYFAWELSSAEELDMEISERFGFAARYGNQPGDYLLSCDARRLAWVANAIGRVMEQEQEAMERNSGKP